MPLIEVVQGLGALGNDTDIIIPRVRQVWTAEEKRRLDRVAADFHRHGDKFLLRCGSAVCPEPVIELVRDRTTPEGMILRCGCRDRVFSPRR